MIKRLTGADIEAAVGDACPLINPRLSEVDWDTVATALDAPGTDTGELPRPENEQVTTDETTARRALVQMIAAALPSVDDHGNLAGDVAEGIADAFYGLRRLASPDTGELARLREALVEAENAIAKYAAIGSRVGGTSIDMDERPGVAAYAYRLSDELSRVWLEWDDKRRALAVALYKPRADIGELARLRAIEVAARAEIAALDSYEETQGDRSSSVLTDATAALRAALTVQHTEEHKGRPQ